MCGVIEGEEAIYLMLSWPGGGFTLDEDILPHKKTVKLTWEQLLFEGARRADFGTKPMIGAAPVTTIEPVTSTRAKESQPKLTVLSPDQPPSIVELDQEYTHVGRSSGNEISLPYPSVSNRHCIFIMSGPDIVLRDLNSSNGTFVNSEAITEVILRPGDMIQIGVVQMKFEPGMKRPKLTNVTNPLPLPRNENNLQEVKEPATSLFRGTTKLPPHKSSGLSSTQALNIKDDSAYVKGQSAISYQDLAQPEPEKQQNPWVKVIIAVVILLIIVAGAYYHFNSAH